MGNYTLVIKENKKDKYNPVTREVKVRTTGLVDFARLVKSSFHGYTLVDILSDDIKVDTKIDETVEGIVSEIVGE